MENLMHANMFSALDLEALQQFCEADSRKLALHMILETLSEAYLQTAIISVRTLLLSYLSALELLVTAKEDPAIAKTDSKALKVACAATEGFQDFTKRCSTSLSTWNLHLHDIILVGDNVFDQEFAMIGYRRGNCSDLLPVAETMQDINPCCVAQEYLTCMSVVARDDELLMSPDTDGRLKHKDIAKWLIEANKDDDDDEDDDDDDDDDEEDDEDEEDVDAGEGEEDVGVEEGDGDNDEDDEDGNEEDDDEKADDGDDGDEEEGEDEDGGDEGEGEEDAEDDDEEDEDEDEEEEDDDEEEEPPKKKRK